MKKLFLLVIFIVLCMIQPFYPVWGQQDKSAADINQKRLTLLRMQGQLDTLDAILKDLGEKRKVLMYDGQQLNNEIQVLVDAAKKRDATDSKLQESHKKSLEGAAKDSAAVPGK